MLELEYYFDFMVHTESFIYLIETRVFFQSLGIIYFFRAIDSEQFYNFELVVLR